MCGITGYYSYTSQNYEPQLRAALEAMRLRGPDVQMAEILSARVGFGHARLSIIDTTASGTQPMHDPTGRYTIIFNGEIFNYRELKRAYLNDITDFHSASDTEVLLHLFIRMGKNCLQHLNGFFAFAVFDKLTQEIFIARDRMGIKPLHIYQDSELLVFASELKAIFAFPIKKELDYNSLALYLQLNYVPGQHSMLRHITRLRPGHYMTIDAAGHTQLAAYYHIPYHIENVLPDTAENYEHAKKRLHQLVDEAVQRRLVSDVPLGAFLSGGIDSSIVVSQAVKYKPDLHTYSIGFSDEPFFDESYYANLVAKKYGTQHTVFSISKNDLLENLFAVLNYLDEPFADSSALAVYILSKHTRQHVTVSLSGDGGDELFAGYNKHKAEIRARQNNILNMALRTALPLLQLFPKSRHSKFGNLFRQAERYGLGLRLSARERYWRWCAFVEDNDALRLLRYSNKACEQELSMRKESVLQYIQDGSINDVLLADTQMVLPNDMLTKVDLMSMANSLEVRVPLLDYTVVNYAFTLPQKFKVSDGHTKKILKDAFRAELPDALFSRPKRGFEVPLLPWFRSNLWSLIDDDLLNDKFVEEQQIFSVAEVRSLKQQLFSANPGEIQARIWGLLVFQYWYRKYFQ